MSAYRSFQDGTQIVTVDLDNGLREVRLEADGEKRSRTLVIPLAIRIGVAVVRMEGIGGVATEEQYRNRGYSRRVLEAAIDVMGKGDAAIATLYGIPDYYPKFGFATCGPEYTVLLEMGEDRSSAAALPDGWTCRSFEPADMPAVMDLYHVNTRGATGAVVRHAAGGSGSDLTAGFSASAITVSGRSWETLANLGSGTDNDACRVLFDDGGDLAAYAWIGRSGWWVQSRERHEPGSFHVGEAMARDPQAADALIVAVQQWAREAASDARFVELVTPPEGLVAHAAAYEGGIFVARHSRQAEFMARTLDAGRLLRQMQPELSARIRGSGCGFEGTLVFRTDEGAAAMAIGPDGVSIEVPTPADSLAIDLPQETLARLVMGAFDARDLLARLPVPPSAQAAALVEILFPRRFPHIHAIDRF
jgi:GNAT superfamily N-acetyltransferase